MALNTGQNGSDAVARPVVATGQALVLSVRRALVLTTAVGRRALLHPVAREGSSVLLLDIGLRKLCLDCLASIRLTALCLFGRLSLGVFSIGVGVISNSRGDLGLARLARRLDDGSGGSRVEAKLLLDLVEAFL